MATAQTMPITEDGHSRRRPFKRFMKRLAKMKTSSDSSNTDLNTQKKKSSTAMACGPYSNNTAQTSIEAPRPALQFLDTQSLSGTEAQSPTEISKVQYQDSLPTSAEDNGDHTAGVGSLAPTIATQSCTTHSDAGRSKAGTFNTGPMSTHEAGGEGSTFTSPSPSVRSLTTTLTTIQSTAPSHLLNNNHNNSQNTQHSHHGGNGPQSATSVHFSHQFPTTSTPASAIPPHVAGGAAGLTTYGSSHPHTYSTATANGMLSDDASIMTLASSTKRRRRLSVDTNASVRALAPSSMFGGSRESLPLSVLSANVQARDTRDQPPGGIQPTLAGTAAAERASIYSSSGVAVALGGTGDGRETRSSYHANRADGASVRSGLLGHGRNDSITGSIGGQVSPLA